MRSMAKPPMALSTMCLPCLRSSPLLTSASTAAAPTAAVTARVDRFGLCRARTASNKPAAAAAVAASAKGFPPGLPVLEYRRRSSGWCKCSRW